MRLEVIVDPAGEHGRFHRRAPRLWQRFHPQVQVKACGGKRSFGDNLATAVLHAVADLPLVNIQSDVIHRFHGGASLVSLNQRPLSSAFVHQALLLRPIHSNLSGVGNLPPDKSGPMITNGMVRRFYRANGAVIRGGGGLPWNYTASALILVRRSFIWSDSTCAVRS